MLPDHQGVRWKEALRPANHGGRKNAHSTPTMVRLRHYLGIGQGLPIQLMEGQQLFPIQELLSHLSDLWSGTIDGGFDACFAPLLPS